MNESPHTSGIHSPVSTLTNTTIHHQLMVPHATYQVPIHLQFQIRVHGKNTIQASGGISPSWDLEHQYSPLTLTPEEIPKFIRLNWDKFTDFTHGDEPTFPVQHD